LWPSAAAGACCAAATLNPASKAAVEMLNRRIIGRSIEAKFQ